MATQLFKYSNVAMKAKAFGWFIKPCHMEGESSTFHRKDKIVAECVHNNEIQWVKFTIKDDRVVEREYNPDIRILLGLDKVKIPKESSKLTC